jgi:hypothetical protein
LPSEARACSITHREERDAGRDAEEAKEPRVKSNAPFENNAFGLVGIAHATVISLLIIKKKQI